MKLMDASVDLDRTVGVDLDTSQHPLHHSLHYNCGEDDIGAPSSSDGFNIAKRGKKGKKLLKRKRMLQDGVTLMPQVIGDDVIP